MKFSEITQRVILVLAACSAQGRFQHDADSSYYENFAIKNKLDTAVVIIGFNRPHYFKEVIAALAANPESKKLPFFFILDGGPKARQQEYIALINAAKIKRSYIIKRKVNFGLHRNIISALRFIFDKCKFNRIIHFEDDVKVTPEYLGLVLNLDNWAHGRYGNIGAVQAFRPSHMTLEEKKGKLALIGETAGLLLGYCLRRSVWDDIKDIVYEYEQKFLVGCNCNKDGQAIKDWMQERLDQGRRLKEIPLGLQRWDIPLDIYYSKIPEMGTGQCGVMTMSFFLKGYSRLTTLVNRAITIGQKGTYYTPELYQRSCDSYRVQSDQG